MHVRAATWEGLVAVEGARLYCRTLGEGPPIVVVHGGPDFDHTYLLPELDRLADSFRLVYYDQRGRGRSAEGVSPDEVSIASEVDDLDAVRRHFGLGPVALLGHSWGGLLAMEFATRRPDHVTHLVLTNTAPAAADDWLLLRQHLAEIRPAGDIEQMQAIASSAAYRAGDLEAEAEYYRIHFHTTLRAPDLLEQVLGRLRAHFTAETVLTARAIEERLYAETWRTAGYDLLPKLRGLDVPTLVLHGTDDFIPVGLAARVADAVPRARMHVVDSCGHFAYLERPEDVHEHVAGLLAGD